MDLILVRFLFVVFVAVTCYVIQPFNLAPKPIAGAVGALLGIAVVIFEWRLRLVSLKRLIGAAIGSVLGIFGAYLFALVIRSSVPAGNTQSFLQIMVMMLMAYVGLIVGSNKGDLLNLAALGGVFGGEKQSRKSYKILDTSVIIDGRIADIAETGFLDGTIVIPQLCCASCNWWLTPRTRSSATGDAVAWTSCNACRRLPRCRYRLWRTIFPQSVKWI